MSDDVPMKRCNKCGEEYPATNEFFTRDKKWKDGLNSACKMCKRQADKSYQRSPDALERRRERNREWSRNYYARRPEVQERYKENARERYKENTERHKEYIKNYRHLPGNLERKREWDRNYSRNPEVREKRRAYREKRRAYVEEYRKGYGDRYREYDLAYNKAYRQRPEVKDRNRIRSRARDALKRAVPGNHTAQQSREQYDRQKGKCYWCGKKLTWGKHHEDHIIPITREGSSNDISNIVIACPACNMSKHNKYPHEFFKGGKLL